MTDLGSTATGILDSLGGIGGIIQIILGYITGLLGTIKDISSTILPGQEGLVLLLISGGIVWIFKERLISYSAIFIAIALVYILLTML